MYIKTTTRKNLQPHAPSQPPSVMADTNRRRNAANSSMYLNWWLDKLLDVTTNPKWSRYLIPALLLMDSILCALIIRTVAYTEIDWRAYMQQVEQYIAGERDYTMIKGDTGPLVYPALHVYLYRALHLLTDQGRSIVTAQMVFAALYVFHLGVTMMVYKAAEVPPYVYPLLVLSKRMHSIYVLRCFNDGFAMTGLTLGIYFFQRRRFALGTIAYAAGLAVKMNLLLVLPAIAALLFQALGTGKALGQAYLILQIQAALALPFIKANWRSYVGRAFDFGRRFNYEWTVNWKFLDEETFLSKEFAWSLIAGHAAFLALFMFTRWLQPVHRIKGGAFKHLLELPPTKDEAEEAQETKKKANRELFDAITPEFIATSIFSAMAVGMLFARSLHFQFFSWIGWATPYLLWRAGLHPGLQYLVWFGQELAWNRFPPDSLSSKLVVGVLAATVIKVWVSTDEKPDAKEVFKAVRQAQMQKEDEAAKVTARAENWDGWD